MSQRKPLDPNEMIAMLGLLKGKNVQYPPELLAARRADFVTKLKSMQSTVTTETSGSSSSSSSTSTPSTSGSEMFGVPVHTLETVLQYVLAGMVALLIATAAYVYRDELLALLNNEPTPEIQLVDTPLPATTELAIPSDTATASSTAPSVLATPEPEQNQPVSTEPAPTDPQPTPTKPGLRLGNTKTPKPTQERNK